mgnify:CR=1 FL=1
MECRKPAAIDRATALRYMGASGWTPDAATAALLDKAEQTVLTAAAPRAVYRRLPRTALPLENCGSDLTRHLQGCNEVLLLAATLGAEVDKLLRRMELTDIALAAAADALASVLLEQVCDELENEIRAQIEAQGVFMTGRYAPGYGDCPLELNDALCLAADTVRERFPDRQVIVIDSLSASIGHGLLVYYAAKLREAGKTVEEAADWVYKNRLKMVHQFTVDDLFFLKRGGRLSGGVAIIGTILQVKPVMHVDNEGRLIVQDKVNGRKKSLNAMFEIFKKNVKDPQNQVIAICHGDCLKDAEYLADKIRTETEVKDIIINFCDPVIGAHSGPGTLALFYMGEAR